MVDQRSAVDVLLEDFRARWQESLNRQAELDRWRSLYLAAVVGGLGWAVGLQVDLDASLVRHPYVVLGLALVNGVFTVVVASQDWYIHQIGLYCHEVIAPRLKALTGEAFNSWERWRRERFEPRRAGGPDSLRKIYHRMISWLPTLVTASILLGAWQTRPAGWPWYTAFSLVVIASSLAVYYAWRTTTRIDRLWKDTLTHTPAEDTDAGGRNA